MQLDVAPTLAQEASNLDANNFPRYWYELTFCQIENMRRAAEKNACYTPDFPEARAAAADEARQLIRFIEKQFPADYGIQQRCIAWGWQREKDHITGDYSASDNIMQQDWRDFVPSLKAQQVAA